MSTPSSAGCPNIPPSSPSLGHDQTKLSSPSRSPIKVVHCARAGQRRGTKMKGREAGDRRRDEGGLPRNKGRRALGKKEGMPANVPLASAFKGGKKQNTEILNVNMTSVLQIQPYDCLPRCMFTIWDCTSRDFLGKEIIDFARGRRTFPV